MWNFYEEIYKQKWFQKGLLITSLEDSPQNTFKCLCKQTPLWCVVMSKKASGTLKIKMTVRKGHWGISPTNAHHTHCTSRQLGTTVDQRFDVPWDWLQDACQIARVHWGTRCKGFCCEGGPHYWTEQSARNPLECEQAPRALGESSRSFHQTSNNQPLFMSLEIPWGFLAWAVLCWLSGGLCHARKCQFEDIMWEEKVWFVIAQLTFAWETFGKRQNGERKLVLILVPGSRKCLASRKGVMCARNMGAHIRHQITKGMRKWDKKLDSCAAKKGLKKLVSSNCAKILEKASSN